MAQKLRRAAELGVDEAKADPLVRAVGRALSELVSAGEVDDLRSRCRAIP
jgi:hypothetical protein